MYRSYNKRAARQSRSMSDNSPTRTPLPRRARNYSDNTGTGTLSFVDAIAEAEDAPIRIQASDLFNENIDPNHEVVVSLSLADLMELNAPYRDLPPHAQVIQAPNSQPELTPNPTDPTCSQILEGIYIGADENLRILLETADVEDWTYENLEGVLVAQYNLRFLSARHLNIGMMAVYRRYSARYYAFGFEYYMRRYLHENYDLWRQELWEEILALVVDADQSQDQALEIQPPTALEVHGHVPLERQITLIDVPPRGSETFFLLIQGFGFGVVQSFLLDEYQDGRLNMNDLRMEMRILLHEYQLDPVDERDFDMRLRNILATRYHERCVWFYQQFENGAITREVLIETLRPLFLTFHFDLDPSWQQQFNAEMDDLMSPGSQRRAHRNRLGQLGQLMRQHHQQLQVQNEQRALLQYQPPQPNPTPMTSMTGRAATYIPSLMISSPAVQLQNQQPQQNLAPTTPMTGRTATRTRTPLVLPPPTAQVNTGQGDPSHMMTGALPPRNQSLTADQVADQDPVPTYNQDSLPSYSAARAQDMSQPQPPSYNHSSRSPTVQMPPLRQYRPGQGPFPPIFPPIMQAQLRGTMVLPSTDTTTRINQTSRLEVPWRRAYRSRSVPPSFGQSELQGVREQEVRYAQPDTEYPRLQPRRSQLLAIEVDAGTGSGSATPEYLSDDGAVFPISIDYAPRHAPAEQ